MAKRLPIYTSDAKAFAKAFEPLTVRHNPWTIYCDFITMLACTISCAVDYEPARREKRVDLLKQTADHYTEEEIKSFEALTEITVSALTDNPRRDFLGELYMSLDFGSSFHGQFFTPWNIAYMMAQMTGVGEEKLHEGKSYFSVCDPCCGAGCMLNAAAQAYSDKGNYQTDILFVGQDIDSVVALTAYVQCSLLGMSGYIAIGNSLANPLTGTDLHPSIGEGGELWFMPMFFSPLWTYRREVEELQLLAARQETKI